MRPMKTLTLIALAALIASCTEEISEELKNSQNSTSQNTTTDLSDSKIKLNHLMDERLSFNLHKAGTIDAPCELAPPDSDGFSASTYYRDPSLSPKPQVIDCILEAQENDLYQNGAEFELTVDAQLCEYIEYTPYKFIERQYGDTSKTIYHVNCASEESECSTGGYCDKYYDNIGAGNTVSAANLMNVINYEGLSCKFDYSNDSYGENCDEGAITTVDLYVDNAKGDFDSNPSTPESCPAGPYTFVQEGSKTEECGGEHSSCFGGPAIEHFGGDTRFAATVYENVNLEEFKQDWKVAPPIDRQLEGENSLFSNKYIANFSRVCSNSDFSKNESGADYSVYNSLVLKGHHYENLSYNPNNLPYRITRSQNTDSGGELDSYSYAENPWRAVNHTSPYYAFRCLDQARDVKAQIRLFIRDWDRDFIKPTSSFAQVSDIGTSVPLMDSYDAHDDRDWNDIKDWDDWFTSVNNTNLPMDVWLNNKCEDTNLPFDPSQFPGHL